MDQNGFNINNFFNGPVFIEGNTDIDGNLDVTGTINGGSGGGVDNPMTADLVASQYSIYDLTEITGFDGILKTNTLDLQNNSIININELKGNIDSKASIKTGNLNLQNNSIFNVNTIQTNIIEGINSVLSVYGDVTILNSLNLSGNEIKQVGSLKAYAPTTTLNLDFIPTSSGTANQVLSRDSKYNPSLPYTHKLVWADPASGFVTNPLTADLNANLKNISLVDKLSLTSITPTDSKGITIDSKYTGGFDSKITISTPILNINNSTNLSPTAIGLTGNITFTNPNATITCPNGLSIKTNFLYNDETHIMVNTESRFIGGLKTNEIGLAFGYDLNITAPKTYLNGRLSNLFSDAKMGTRNVRTSLYKAFGNNTLTNDFNSLIPVPIDSKNGPSIGSAVLIANTMNTGDKLKITLNCSLSTSAVGDMNIYVYMGTNYANRKLQTSFITPNTSTSLTTSIIDIELDCIIVNSVMTFDKVALMSITKSNTATRMIIGFSTSVVNQINPTQDNYIYIFGSVSSIIGIATIQILGETIEHY